MHPRVLTDKSNHPHLSPPQVCLQRTAGGGDGRTEELVGAAHFLLRLLQVHLLGRLAGAGELRARLPVLPLPDGVQESATRLQHDAGTREHARRPLVHRMVSA